MKQSILAFLFQTPKEVLAIKVPLLSYRQVPVYFLAISDYLAGGVSAGYVYSLSTPKMVLEGMEEVEIQNAPEMPLHQWYVKFSLGFGNFVNL